MKLAASKILVMSILLAMVMEVNAQVSRQEQEFLSSYFTRSITKHSKIYYSPNLYSGEIFGMKEYLKKYATRSRSKGDTLYVLNEYEITYAISAIDSLQKISWGDSIVENAKLVPDDTLKVLYKNIEQDWDCLNSYGGKIWSFSHPIFLRGGTLCLFYYGTFSGPLNAYGCFSIYGKIGDAWFELEGISEWVS